MNKSKISLLATAICLVVLFFSCIKDPEKLMVETAKPQTVQVQSRENAPSLFGNDHIVPANIAKVLAQKINLTVSEAMRVGTSTTVRTVDSLFTISDSLGTPVMYIANYVDDGYVVISADDRHEPICALVEQGKYEVAEVPSMLVEWFHITFENILLLRSGAIPSSNFADMNIEWVKVIKDIGEEEHLTFDDCCPDCPNYPECCLSLKHPNISGCEDICEGGNYPCGFYTTTRKGPLMTTRWNQGCSYNEQCPDKDCADVCFSNENAWTGCVATAMAQILRYWAHPCSQRYNYTTMPNNSGNSEVQRMMRDAGNAVDMDYGCDASSASGDKTDNAFRDDFCYTSATYSQYNSGSYQTVIQNINENKPVLLDGCRTRRNWFGLFYTYSNCHMWVCDGYERNQNNCYSILKFHMNWGWGPNGGNGWYSFNLWSSSLGNYQYAQNFTHNIQP